MLTAPFSDGAPTKSMVLFMVTEKLIATEYPNALYGYGPERLTLG
jgi:hypothetical protein